MKLRHIFLAALISSTNAMAMDGSPLTGEQIKALFVGKTFDIQNLETGKSLQAFTPNDSVYLVNIHWKKKISKRKWWLEGDKRCRSHPKKGDSCVTITDVGGGTYHAYDDKGEHTRTLSSFVEGKKFTM